MEGLPNIDIDTKDKEMKPLIPERFLSILRQHVCDIAPESSGPSVKDRLGDCAIGLLNAEFHRCEPPLEVLNLKIKPGTSLAVTGPNGAGKSTLFSGIFHEGLGFSVHKNEGSYVFGTSKKQRDFLRVAVLKQEEILQSVFDDNVSVFLESIILYYAEENRKNLFKELQNIFQTDNFFDRKIGELSGGEKTKLSLIMLFFSNPDVIILDEPTNHLDLSTVIKLIELLKKYKSQGGAVLCSSHVSWFLKEIGTDGVVNVTWNSDGSRVAQTYTSSYENFSKNPTLPHKDIMQGSIKWPTSEYKRSKVENKRMSRRQMNLSSMTEKRISDLESRIFEIDEQILMLETKVKEINEQLYELYKLETGDTLQLGEIENDILSLEIEKGNLQPSMRKLKAASRTLQDDLKKIEDIDTSSPDNSRTGNVIMPSRVFSIDESPIHNITIPEIFLGDKVILTGDNGTGKTKFLSQIFLDNLDKLKARKTNLKIAYLPQSWPEEISAGTIDDLFNYVKNSCGEEGESSKDIFIKKLKENYFSGGRSDILKLKISEISGGEQRLLWFFIVSSLSDIDLLILDEPTNHIDQDIQAIITEAIKDFKGSVLLATHDINLMNNFKSNSPSLPEGVKHWNLKKTPDDQTMLSSEDRSFSSYVSEIKAEAQKKMFFLNKK